MKGAAVAPRGVRHIFFGKTEHGSEAMNILVSGGSDTPSPDTTGLIAEDAVRKIVDASAAQRWKHPPNESGFRALLHTLRLIQVTDPPIRHEHNDVDLVKNATVTLTKHLPRFIANHRVAKAKAEKFGIEPWRSEAQAQALVALHEAAEAAKGSFYWRRTRPVRRESWHLDAEAIAFHATIMWHANRPGSPMKPTSPVNRLIAALLPLVDCGMHTPEAIAAVFRHRGTRKG